MKIAQIKISSILGINELEFTPEGFNEISGPNGTGKTSVLEAIKSVITGGHDATLLRTGADKGEIVLVLDDGTQIRKRVTEKASPVEVVQDGERAKRPTDVIKALTDMLSVNPVDFLRAPKKDRVRVLLETMPLEVDTEKLAKLSGIPVQAEPGAHALGVIDLIRKQVFDDRTGTNRAVKEKDNTINQLRLAMPDVPGGADGSEDELRAQVEAATAAKDAELDRVRTKLDGIKAANQAKIDEIRVDTQTKIDAIKAEALAAVEAIQATQADIESKAGIQREKTIQKHTDTVTPLNQTIEAIKANRGAHAKREQAQETIKQMETELDDLQQDAVAQTKALDNIDKYKMDLLSALPIPGVEVIDGDIFRDGVQFDRLNTAQQVWIAVEIAKLRAGDLGIMCVDGIECLDKKAYDELKAQFMDCDLQIFVTRVTNEDFRVTTGAGKEDV